MLHGEHYFFNFLSVMYVVLLLLSCLLFINHPEFDSIYEKYIPHVFRHACAIWKGACVISHKLLQVLLCLVLYFMHAICYSVTRVQIALLQRGVP